MMSFQLSHPIPYDSWHVIVGYCAAYISALLLILSLNNLLARIGLILPDTESFSFGFNIGILIHQVLVLGIFLMVLLISTVFGEYASDHNAIWVNYNSDISFPVIIVTITIAACTCTRTARKARSSRKSAVDKKAIVNGKQTAATLIPALIALSGVPALFMRHSYDLYKTIAMTSLALALITFIVAVSAKSLRVSRTALMVALLLACNIVSIVFADELLVRYQLSGALQYLKGVYPKIEAMKDITGQYPDEIPINKVLDPPPPVLVRQSQEYMYHGLKDHYELQLWGASTVTYKYSSTEKRWSAHMSDLWY